MRHFGNDLSWSLWDTNHSELSRFPSLQYYLPISPLNNSFHLLFPLDIDIGTNGDVTYSFTPDSTKPFAIDSITGVITLTQRVTYSLANEWYNYTINAMDSAVDSERRFDYAELAIRVCLPLNALSTGIDGSTVEPYFHDP